MGPKCEEFESKGKVGEDDNQTITGWACPVGGSKWEAHQDLPIGELLKQFLKGW